MKRTGRSTALVRFRMNDYSAPAAYGFRDVLVKGFVDEGDHKGATIIIHTHQTAPTHFVDAAGVRFAYRRFGKSGGVPIVFNQHYIGTMDYWDPAVTDGLARDREVILCQRCEPCRLFGPGLNYLEIDAKIYGNIECARELQHYLRGHLGALVAERSAIVVTNADRLSNSAADILLKAVEEQPGTTTFIFVLHEMSALQPALR